MVQRERIPVQTIACGILKSQRRTNVGTVEMRLKTARKPPGSVIGQRTVVVEEIVVIAIECGERGTVGVVPGRGHGVASRRRRCIEV